MSEQGGEKSKGISVPAGHLPSAPPPPPNYYYGTFQGVANYPPPSSQPFIGFPQSMPPLGFSGPSPQYCHHGYQIVPGYAVVTGRPFREERLPCCGIGVGWFLLSGWVLVASFLDFVCKVYKWFLSWCHSMVYWHFSADMRSVGLQRKGWSGCVHFSCNPSFHCSYSWCDKGISFLVNFSVSVYSPVPTNVPSETDKVV